MQFATFQQLKMVPGSFQEELLFCLLQRMDESFVIHGIFVYNNYCCARVLSRAGCLIKPNIPLALLFVL